MQFVVLHHTGVASPHFDLMFETAADSLLTTFRSPVWPIERATPLRRLGEHRRDYLSYQGSLSDNRGEVRRVAAGDCQLDRRDDDSFWSIRFDDPLLITLNIKRASGDQWLAVPSCGG